MKVRLLLNHIDDSCLEIYLNFVYLPERDDPAGGEAKLLAKNPDNYATVLAKFEAYFQNGYSTDVAREILAFIFEESRHKPSILGLPLQRKRLPNASFLSIFTRKL